MAATFEQLTGTDQPFAFGWRDINNAPVERDDIELFVVPPAGEPTGPYPTEFKNQVVAGVLAEGRTTSEAIERPRMPRVGDAVMIEPEPDGEAALVAAGFDLRRFKTRHHFFGRVSGIGRADSRRDGATRTLV